MLSMFSLCVCYTFKWKRCAHTPFGFQIQSEPNHRPFVANLLPIAVAAAAATPPPPPRAEAATVRVYFIRTRASLSVIALTAGRSAHSSPSAFV